MHSQVIPHTEVEANHETFVVPSLAGDIFFIISNIETIFEEIMYVRCMMEFGVESKIVCFIVYQVLSIPFSHSDNIFNQFGNLN